MHGLHDIVNLLTVVCTEEKRVSARFAWQIVRAVHEGLLLADLQQCMELLCIVNVA